MADVGRPTIEINWDEFDKLCGLQCTLVEIADWFECSEDTIQRRVQEEFGSTFTELYAKKSARGKMSIRRKQVELALSGNVTMLIWLGKQYLGQRDKQSGEEESSRPQVFITATEELLANVTRTLSKKPGDAKE